MTIRARKSFGLPETWWYALRVMVYFAAAASGVVWLAWALRMPLEPDVVRRAQRVTPAQLLSDLDRWSDVLVELPADVVTDLQVQETGDAIEPWSVCTLAEPLSFRNTKILVGGHDRLPGCLVTLESAPPTVWQPVTDRTTGRIAGRLKAAVPALDGMPILAMGDTVTADTSGPLHLRIVRRHRLLQAMPHLALPTTTTAPRGAPTLIALWSNHATATPASARTRVAIAGTGNRVWLELPPGFDAPEPGPIYARAERVARDELPLADALVTSSGDDGLILNYLPVRAAAERLPRERRYNLFLACSLILLGLLGLVHHIQSSRRAEVEDIVLYAANADATTADEDSVELPRIPADQVPPERAMDLVPRSRTLKDWVFATDADRRAFIRLCVVKWTGGADPEHLEKFEAFLTAAIAELLREFGGDASGDTPSRQQAWMLWAPMLKHAADVVAAGTTPEEAPVLAAARYTTVHSPAFAAMLNARPLRWFVRVGAETMGIARNQSHARQGASA